jgi:hypothetical protein
MTNPTFFGVAPDCRECPILHSFDPVTDRMKLLFPAPVGPTTAIIGSESVMMPSSLQLLQERRWRKVHDKGREGCDNPVHFYPSCGSICAFSLDPSSYLHPTNHVFGITKSSNDAASTISTPCTCGAGERSRFHSRPGSEIHTA